MPEKYLDRSALADRLGCSPAWVSQLVKEGLPALRLGRKLLRFDPEAVKTWLDERTRAGK
jgi:excisionase family DNA binding protein